MFKKLSVVLALSMAATAANAVTFTFAPGAGGNGAGETLITDFNTSANDGLVSGSNFLFLTNTTGQGALPGAGDGSRYLSVLGGGSGTINFAPATQVSFDYGSADSYNNIIVNLVGGGSFSFSGTTLAPPANGNQGADATNGRVSFFSEGNERIQSLTFASGSNSLEVDNVSTIAAVPEPGQWAMLIVGFGLTASALRRRPKMKTALA